MPINYSLKVTQMDTVPQAEGQANVVVRVHWAYTGTDGTNSAGFGGTTDVTYTGGPFTGYADLTEGQVAGWVLAAWSDEERDRYQNAIAAQLAAQSPPLPWTPAEEAAPEPELVA